MGLGVSTLNYGLYRINIGPTACSAAFLINGLDKAYWPERRTEVVMEGRIGDEVPCSSIAVDAVLRIGTAGAIWGSCSGSYEANQLGLSGISRAPFMAKSVGRFGFQWGNHMDLYFALFFYLFTKYGLFAAIFSFTRCGIQRYRRQNDWVNALIGGAVAGAAIGAGTRNWKQVAGVTGLVCALYHAADDAKSFYQPYEVYEPQGDPHSLGLFVLTTRVHHSSKQSNQIHDIFK